MRVSVALAALLVAVGTNAHAASTDCPEHFAGGAAPDLVNAKLNQKARALCFQQFAVLHSGITRTPLYSAEHLTRDRVAAAKGLERPDANAFHPDPRLPPDERAELNDYKRSGFDRGHLAPNGDMSFPEAQQESFSLANMLPQVPENNRGVWSEIESAVRHLTNQRGELYVVTGPLFQGVNLQRIGGRVLVPTHVFKAVYDPKRTEAGAYIAPNEPGGAYQRVPLAELESAAGISLFPGLPASAKGRLMDLPEPKARGGSRSKKEESLFSERDVMRFLKELVR